MIVCAAVVVCGGVYSNNRFFRDDEFESVVCRPDGDLEEKEGDAPQVMVAQKVIAAEPQSNKAPLVFIGSYQNVRYWKRVVTVLCSKGHECHLLSVPGSMSEKVVRVSSYISSANLSSTPPIIFGHSLGAVTAQGYASDSANPCGGLVLVAPVGFAGDEVRNMR